MLVRALFWLLLGFEFLHWVGVLHILELEFSWAGLLITGGAVYAFLELLHLRLKKIHKTQLPWFVFLFGLTPISFDAVGDMFHLYSQYAWYDQVAHFLGSAMAVAVVFSFFAVLKAVNHINWNLATNSFFAFTTAVMFGVLYELEEFGEDVIACYHREFLPQFLDKLLPCGYRFGDAFDTGTDLFLDVVGGLAAVAVFLLAQYFMKRSSTKT